MLLCLLGEDRVSEVDLASSGPDKLNKSELDFEVEGFKSGSSTGVSEFIDFFRPLDRKSGFEEPLS